MQLPSVTSHIHEHVDLHTSLILFLVPVSSGVEAAGRYRPGSPERVGWVGAGWPQRFVDGRGRGGGGKMQSRCHCCLPPARNRRRETLLVSQVAPPASRDRGAVLVLCVARTREAGEATEKRLAGGREVERSWCPGPELGLCWYHLPPEP